MEKGMCLGSIGISILVFLLFLADLITGSPFGGSDSPFMMVDLFGILACAFVGYLGWNALRDLK